MLDPRAAQPIDPGDLLPQPVAQVEQLHQPLFNESRPLLNSEPQKLAPGITFKNYSFIEPQSAALPRSLEAFPQTYFESRSRFVDLLRTAGGKLHSHEIAARGPDGQALHIDIGVLGAQHPKRAVLHIAGMHGIEGFVGSAIQSELLRAKPIVSGDYAIVLVHCLNPWGMANLRRTNEDNVDLNRNFMPQERHWSGTPEGYALLSTLLNPGNRREFAQWFYLPTITKVLRHGFSALKQAVLDGQFDDPRGLMFGGQKPAESTRILDTWLRRELSGAERIIGIDVHAGMGPFARQTLFIEQRRSNPRVAALEAALGMPLTTLPEGSGGYQPTARGAACDEIPMLLQAERVDWLLQEFGTFSALRMLRCLRDENFLFHHGTVQERQEYTHYFKDMFNPPSFIWREAVLRTGVRLVARAAAELSSI